MTEKDHDPTTPAPPSEGAGHANPSFDTRFRKGVSGNPAGRRPGSRNKRTIVEAILNEKVTIRDGGRTCKMSKFEVMVTRAVNDAVKGNHKAWAAVMLLIKTYNLVDKLPEPDIFKPLTADDDALLANFVSRIRGDASPPGDGPSSEKGR